MIAQRERGVDQLFVSKRSWRAISRASLAQGKPTHLQGCNEGLPNANPGQPAGPVSGRHADLMPFVYEILTGYATNCKEKGCMISCRGG